MKKLAIISTHPIQYNAPWFHMLAARDGVELKVFYTWSQTKHGVDDIKFGRKILWDTPIFEGYEYEFVENVAKRPGSYHFFGIDCPSLVPKIDAFNPSAILVFGWNFKSHLQVIYHFYKKYPLWFRGDSTLLDEKSGFKTLLRRIFLKQVYSYIDKAFYVGQANKSYFLKHGLKTPQLVYAPHAVDNRRFSDIHASQDEIRLIRWREALGFEKTDLIVLFAGKFEHKKQPEFLLKAIKKANEFRLTPVKLLLVGNGSMENKLRTMANESSNVYFLPFQNQSQMPLVYRLGDVLCLPSRGPGESWGLSINEAMASGKPVIVSDKVGCSIDLVKPGRNGYIFDSHNMNELVSILSRLSLENLKVLGRNAIIDIQKYNFEAIVEAIDHSIKDLKI